MNNHNSKNGYLRLLKYAGYLFSGFLGIILIDEGLPPETVLILLGSLATGGYSHYLLDKLAKTEDEIRLVSLIRQHEGMVTIADIMIEFNCSGKEAIRKVKALQRQGIVGADVSASGDIIYNLSSAYLG